MLLEPAPMSDSSVETKMCPEGGVWLPLPTIPREEDTVGGSNCRVEYGGGGGYSCG